LRDPNLVLKDVEDGLVSKKAAQNDYGVVLKRTAKGLSVDSEETDRHRKPNQKGS
jgi:N-methylhydantoinase B/oxoprolinase/acetone carboxylase alpha subunit